MPAEQMVMDETIENLLRAFRKKLTPNAVRRLLEIGVDTGAKLKPLYPRKIHDDAIRVLAEEYYGGKPIDQGAYAVGEASIRVLEESIMGRTLMRMLRLLPHKAALRRLPTIMRIGNNYLDVTVVETGPRAYTIEFNEIGAWPQYWVGLMNTANRALLGYARSTVELESYDGHRAVLAIDLEPP